MDGGIRDGEPANIRGGDHRDDPRGPGPTTNRYDPTDDRRHGDGPTTDGIQSTLFRKETLYHL